MKQQRINRVLGGLGRRRVGLHYSLGRHLRHCGLSCTLALRVLLGSEGECGQYQHLALGCSLFLGGVLGLRWKLSWFRGCLLCRLLILLHSTC